MERLKTGGDSILRGKEGSEAFPLSSHSSALKSSVDCRAALLSFISKKNTMVLARGREKSAPVGRRAQGNLPDERAGDGDSLTLGMNPCDDLNCTCAPQNQTAQQRP